MASAVSHMGWPALQSMRTLSAPFVSASWSAGVAGPWLDSAVGGEGSVFVRVIWRASLASMRSRRILLTDASRHDALPISRVLPRSPFCLARCCRS
jgi:hypothetical protein